MKFECTREIASGNLKETDTFGKWKIERFNFHLKIAMLSFRFIESDRRMTRLNSEKISIKISIEFNFELYVLLNILKIPETY